MKSAFAVVLIALTAAVPARSATYTSSERYATDGVDRLSVTFPVGDLKVEAGEGDEIVATLTARCRYGGRGCDRRAERLKLVQTQRTGTLRLKLEGYPRFDFGGLVVTLRLRMPRRMPVETHMGVGDVQVRGLARDVDVHMGIGDVDIRMPQESVGSVQAHVGIGDASLHRAAGRIEGSGFIAQKLKWQSGSGRGQVEVHLGVGSVDVSLR
jgi:hypothetical protein